MKPSNFRRKQQSGRLWPRTTASQLYIQQREDLSDGCSVLLNIPSIFNKGKSQWNLTLSLHSIICRNLSSSCCSPRSSSPSPPSSSPPSPARPSYCAVWRTGVRDTSPGRRSLPCRPPVNLVITRERWQPQNLTVRDSSSEILKTIITVNKKCTNFLPNKSVDQSPGEYFALRVSVRRPKASWILSLQQRLGWLQWCNCGDQRGLCDLGKVLTQQLPASSQPEDRRTDQSCHISLADSPPSLLSRTDWSSLSSGGDWGDDIVLLLERYRVL